jgi:transposase
VTEDAPGPLPSASAAVARPSDAVPRLIEAGGVPGVSVADAGFTPHIRGRREEIIQRTRGKRARRWVVERTHSWMNRFRGLLTRWEKRTANDEGSLHLACADIAFARAGLLG